MLSGTLSSLKYLSKIFSSTPHPLFDLNDETPWIDYCNEECAALYDKMLANKVSLFEVKERLDDLFSMVGDECTLPLWKFLDSLSKFIEALNETAYGRFLQAYYNKLALECRQNSEDKEFINYIIEDDNENNLSRKYPSLTKRQESYDLFLNGALFEIETVVFFDPFLNRSVSFDDLKQDKVETDEPSIANRGVAILSKISVSWVLIAFLLLSTQLSISNVSSEEVKENQDEGTLIPYEAGATALDRSTPFEMVEGNIPSLIKAESEFDARLQLILKEENYRKAAFLARRELKSNPQHLKAKETLRELIVYHGVAETHPSELYNVSNDLLKHSKDGSQSYQIAVDIISPYLNGLHKKLLNGQLRLESNVAHSETPPTNALQYLKHALRNNLSANKRKQAENLYFGLISSGVVPFAKSEIDQMIDDLEFYVDKEKANHYKRYFASTDILDQEKLVPPTSPRQFAGLTHKLREHISNRKFNFANHFFLQELSNLSESDTHLMMRIYECYKEGILLPQDMKYADGWLTLAANKGDVAAAQIISNNLPKDIKNDKQVVARAVQSHHHAAGYYASIADSDDAHDNERLISTLEKLAYDEHVSICRQYHHYIGKIISRVENRHFNKPTSQIRYLASLSKLYAEMQDPYGRLYCLHEIEDCLAQNEHVLVSARIQETINELRADITENNYSIYSDALIDIKKAFQKRAHYSKATHILNSVGLRYEKIALNPDFAEYPVYMNFLHSVFKELGNVLEKTPDYSDGYVFYGRVCSILKKHDELLDILETLTEYFTVVRDLHAANDIYNNLLVIAEESNEKKYIKRANRLIVTLQKEYPLHLKRKAKNHITTQVVNEREASEFASDVDHITFNDPIREHEETTKKGGYSYTRICATVAVGLASLGIGMTLFNNRKAAKARTEEAAKRRLGQRHQKRRKGKIRTDVEEVDLRAPLKTRSDGLIFNQLPRIMDDAPLQLEDTKKKIYLTLKQSRLDIMRLKFIQSYFLNSNELKINEHIQSCLNRLNENSRNLNQLIADLQSGLAILHTALKKLETTKIVNEEDLTKASNKLDEIQSGYIKLRSRILSELLNINDVKITEIYKKMVLAIKHAKITHVGKDGQEHLVDGHTVFDKFDLHLKIKTIAEEQITSGDALRRPPAKWQLRPKKISLIFALVEEIEAQGDNDAMLVDAEEPQVHIPPQLQNEPEIVNLPQAINGDETVTDDQETTETGILQINDVPVELLQTHEFPQPTLQSYLTVSTTVIQTMNSTSAIETYLASNNKSSKKENDSLVQRSNSLIQAGSNNVESSNISPLHQKIIDDFCSSIHIVLCCFAGNSVKQSVVLRSLHYLTARLVINLCEAKAPIDNLGYLRNLLMHYYAPIYADPTLLLDFCEKLAENGYPFNTNQLVDTTLYRELEKAMCIKVANILGGVTKLNSKDFLIEQFSLIASIYHDISYEALEADVIAMTSLKMAMINIGEHFALLKDLLPEVFDEHNNSNIINEKNGFLQQEISFFHYLAACVGKIRVPLSHKAKLNKYSDVENEKNEKNEKDENDNVIDKGKFDQLLKQSKLYNEGFLETLFKKLDPFLSKLNETSISNAQHNKAVTALRKEEGTQAPVLRSRSVTF